MPAGEWEFRWSSANGTQYNLPCIDERKISFKLNQAGSCELTIPLRTDVGRHIATGDGWGYILAYKNNTLRMVLETVSTDVGPASSEGIPSVAIVGTESAYMRAAGIVLAASAPYSFPAAPASQVGVNLATLLAANPTWGIGADSPGVTPVISASLFDTGIDLLSLIQSVAFRATGFDFRFNPAFTNLGLGQQIVGNFQSASTIGVTRSNCVFEYGNDTRANLTSFSWKRIAGENLVNNVYVPSNGSSAGNAAGTATAGDLGSAFTYGARARWITADFDDYGLRLDLANDHVAFRKQPRRVLSITPNANMGLGNVPVPLEEYGIGDKVPVLIKDDGITLVSGTLRVYGLNFTIDKDGKENVETETSPET